MYKYCALIIFQRSVSHVIEILKGARDHVIPLRREVAIALQRNTEEHFGFFNWVKKYMTYANIKLPVIFKVINHLMAARRSSQFKAKIQTLFKIVHKLEQYPIIRSLQALPDHKSFDWVTLSDKITEDTGELTEDTGLPEQSSRMARLYDEDNAELRILSSELSQVLPVNSVSLFL